VNLDNSTIAELVIKAPLFFLGALIFIGFFLTIKELITRNKRL